MTSRAKQVLLIRDIFRAIPNDLQCGFTDCRTRLYMQCLAAEKEHRQGRSTPRDFSMPDAARYFTIRYLRDYATTPARMPTLSEYLHVRHECYTAAAIVCQHTEELLAWCATIDAGFDAIDYSDLMKDSQS